MFRTQFYRVVSLATVLIGTRTPVAAEIYLGDLTDNKDFDLKGSVYAISNQVLEIRGFNYKGGAPDPFFWADATPLEPTQQGFILQESSPTSSCGTAVLPNTTSLDKPPTYRVEFPTGTSIRSVLNGTISVWCRAMFVNLGSVNVPATLDGLEDTARSDLVCNGVRTDRFNLYDRIVKPVTYLLGGLWEDVTNIWSSRTRPLAGQYTDDPNVAQDLADGTVVVVGRQGERLRRR